MTLSRKQLPRENCMLLSINHALIPHIIRVVSVLLLSLVLTRLIVVVVARAITCHTRASKNTDYCHSCTRMCVIIYTNDNINDRCIIIGSDHADGITLQKSLQKYNSTCKCTFGVTWFLNAHTHTHKHNLIQ